MAKIFMTKKVVQKGLLKIDDLLHSIGPTRVLFVVRNTLGIFCLLPIIEEMQKRKGFKVAITLELPDCYAISKETQSIFDNYYISSNRAVNKKWHYVMTTEWTNLWFKRNTTQVFTNHGNAYGNLDYQPKSANNYIKNLVLRGSHQLYFCNADGDSEEFQGWIDTLPEHSGKKCIITGLARADKLAGFSQEDANNYLTGIGADSKNTTLVIGSHWTEKSLFCSIGVDFVATLCQNFPEMNVLVMGHGNLWRDQAGSLWLQMVKINEEYENCFFLPNLEDTCGLLKSGDIFIGDNSSIFVEYCMMDKPILFFDNPKLTFSNEKVGHLFKAAAISFSTESNLIKSVIDVLTKPDELKVHRSAVVNHFLSNLGNASEAVVDVIENLGKGKGK